MFLKTVQTRVVSKKQENIFQDKLMITRWSSNYQTHLYSSLNIDYLPWNYSVYFHKKNFYHPYGRFFYSQPSVFSEWMLLEIRWASNIINFMNPDFLTSAEYHEHCIQKERFSFNPFSHSGHCIGPPSKISILV